MDSLSTERENTSWGGKLQVQAQGSMHEVYYEVGMVPGTSGLILVQKASLGYIQKWMIAPKPRNWETSSSGLETSCGGQPPFALMTYVCQQGPGSGLFLKYAS